MPSRGVQQLLTLPPAPDSARTARRFVSEVLRAARADDFVDTTTLLASELVTNGIVHAHTDLQILVEATATWVRVEVVDGNPRLPSRREYDENATTGRGLEMVELLADDFGVEPVDGGGKRVWFRLGAVPGTPVEPGQADAGHLAPAVPITLLGLPITLYTAWQQHAEALLREATIASLDKPEVEHGDWPLAGRALGALADAAAKIFGLREQDVEVSDVTLHVDRDAVHFFPILREMLATATVMSEAGQLLVPPSLPEIAAIRRWVCDEIARQSAGLPPTTWVDPCADDAAPPTAAAATLAEVREAPYAAMAADAGNRIVAVSPAAAALLGWEPADLEGRRLVSIVPPRLRDKHIAGFTRHLLDGHTTVLGHPYTTQALHRDGTEIEITLVVERRPDPLTRALFIARLAATDD